MTKKLDKFNKDIYNLDWVRRDGRLYLKMLTHERQNKKIEYVPCPESPYFYISKKDLKERREEIVKTLSSLAPGYSFDRGNYELYKAWRMDEGGKMVRISIPFPDQTPDIIDILEEIGVKTRESDLAKEHTFKRAILKDYDLTISMPKNVLYFDIEILAKAGLPDVENPTQRIISIAAIGSDGEHYFFCDESEKKLIQGFRNIAKQYTVLAGYNAAKFDKPYLINRAERLGIRIDPFFYPVYDVLRLLRRGEKKGRESYSLKAVAKEDFDMDLRSYEKPGEMQKLTEFFKNDRVKLYNYNIGDVEATKRICEKYDLIKTFNRLAQICHIHPYQKLWPSVFIDGLLLNMAKDLDPVMVFDRRRYHEDSEKEGALVECYGEGLYEKAVTLDFSSYYPTLIKTFNMGIDTFDPSGESEIKAPYGSFRKDEESIMVRAVNQLYNIRERAKKKMRNCEPGTKEWKFWYSKSWAAKLILVSFFGVMGFENSRIYRQEIFENITGLGKDLIKKSKAIGESLGYTGLYSDTDSVIFNMKPSKSVNDVEEDLKSINYMLQQYCKEKYNTSSKKLRLKIDRVYKTLRLLGKKKRYFGLTMIEGEKRTEKLIVKGLESIRSDWPPIARKIQRKCMKMITEQLPYSDIIQYLREKRREVLDGEHDKKFIVYTGLGQALDKYESTGPHVRVAKKLKKQGVPIRSGDKIPHIWTGEKAIPALDEENINLNTEDRRRLWKKHIDPVIERVGVNPKDVVFDRFGTHD